MAVKVGSLHGPQVVGLHVAGLVACFVGERIIGGEGLTRWLVTGLGAGAAVVASLLLLLAWLRSADAARRIERLAFGLSLLSLIGLGLYFLGSDLVMGPAPVARDAEAGPGLRQLLQVAWPIVMTCALLPLVFLQWSLASMGQGLGIEFGRVRASTTAAGSLAMLLCTLFLVNAVANEKDTHTDLSYFRTTSPSESTRSMIEGLTEDTQALLFFPKANDVLAEVEPYFRELTDLSGKFSVEQVDRAMQPELAEKYRVSKEGAVVLVRGGSHRKIDLGDSLDSAKRKLRKLDKEFQSAFMKLAFKREAIYLITGHGERGTSKVEGDQRARISILKRGLEESNFTVKRIDAVDGLSEAIPDDAAMVLWAGPTHPLFPGEQAALNAYLDRGGRMLLLLDPEGEHQPDGLLAHLGLAYDRTPLAHGRYFLQDGLSRTPAERYNLVTNKYSNHPATKTVSRFSHDLPVAMPTTGSLRRAKGARRDNRITFLVRSLPNTWADTDGDFNHGKDEPFKVFQLAAAVSRKIEPDKREKPKLEKPKLKKPAPGEKADGGVGQDAKAKQDSQAESDGKTKTEAGEGKKAAAGDTPRPDDVVTEMRVAVFADAGLFADKHFEFRGNRFLLIDVLRWLLDEERVAGGAESEEDRPVVHTRSEDVWWFYLTVCLIPLLILGLGFKTGWGRGRRKEVRR